MPSFFIEQFGCRATQADGAALERQLLDRGCSSASTAAAADIVVINTCTVTASADAQARDAIRKLHAPVRGGEGHPPRPTLKIQDGCNSRCSYCVIPFVRGKSRSLPPEAVIREIHHLTESGFREIVLSGINLGTYGRDLSPRVEFEDLLRRILNETSHERLRITPIYPFPA